MPKEVKRILIVDDEASDLEIMKNLLEKEGYKVVAAADPSKALDLLKASCFDLILIDLVMPNLSGYTLSRIMRERSNCKAKMVYVSIIPKIEVDMTHIDGFIQKPFSPKTFLAEIKEVLAK